MVTSIVGITAVYNILPERKDERKHEMGNKDMLPVTEKMNVHPEKITVFIT